MFEYQAEAITRTRFNFESEIFSCSSLCFDHPTIEPGFGNSVDVEPDFPVIPYESAWECYGGLSEEESWAELYAELND